MMDIDYNELLKDPDLTTSIRLRIYGVMYEKEGKLEEAYQAYLSEVEKGNAEAMFFIGNLYFFSCYEAQSDGGSGSIFQAMQRGGIMMPWQTKEGKIPNYAKALEWFLKSADAGWVPGLISAACMIYEGQGSPKDDEKAKKLLTQAAEAGDTRAVVVLKDFFGISTNITYSMTEYRQMLQDFEALQGDVHALYYKLLLGSPLQLYKLGYVLAKLHYSHDGFLESFPFATRPDKHPYAPIDHVRFNWGSTIIVNMDAFDEEEFTLSYALDPSLRAPDTLKWIASDLAHDGNGYPYTGTPFSWMKTLRHCTLLQVSRKYGYLGQSDDGQEAHVWDENPKFPFNRDSKFRIRHMKLYHDIKEKNVAVFYDCHEKEFDIEICHVVAGSHIPIFRYTDC